MEEQSSESSKSSVDESMQMSFQSKIESAQYFDDDLINISSDSEKSSSSESHGNGKNLNKRQKLFASQTESSSYKRNKPDLLDSGDETETELRYSDSPENQCSSQTFHPRKRLKSNINLMDEASQPPLITRQNAQYYDKILTVSTVDLCTPALETQNLEPIPTTSHHSHQPPIVSTIDLCTPALESQDFEAVASTSSQVDKESQTDDVIICKKT